MRILKWIWTIILTLALVLCATHSYSRQLNIAFFKNISPLMLLENAFVILLVFSLIFKLRKYKPVFAKSWISYITKNKNHDKNITFLPFSIKYFSILFGGLLLFNSPSIALMEELIFRNGTSNWLEGIWRSALFGFAHYVSGAPLSAGLILPIAGMWFTHKYFIGGLELAAQNHFSYNFIVLSLALLSIIKSHFVKKQKTITK